MTPERAIEALREALSEMEAIGLPIKERASLVGYFCNRVAALAQPASVPAGSRVVENRLLADLRDSMFDYKRGIAFGPVDAVALGKLDSLLAAAPQAPQPAHAVMVDMVPPATRRDRWFYEQGRLAERDPRTHALEGAPQPEAQPKWQPIETAPKDGTHILVWTDASDTAYVVCWADAAKGIRKYLTAESGAARGWHLAWDGALFDREHEPTHWMPLPAAPSAQAEPTLAELREKLGGWDVPEVSGKQAEQ